MRNIYQQHRELAEHIHRVFVAKNKDYGNSFEEQMDEYGDIAGLIRIEDKFRRLKQLSKQEAEVKDEAKRDTLLDMANYALMYVMWLDKNEAE
jgi:hypothetical protein